MTTSVPLRKVLDCHWIRRQFACIPIPALGLLFLTSFAPKEFAQHSRALIGEHS